MRRPQASIAAASALLALGAPSSAFAQIEADGAIIGTAVLGTIAGVTNAIAVSVYAVEGRSLGSGWIVSSMFSSAICGAISVSFVVSAANDGANLGKSIGLIFYTFLAAWPGYYVVRSALSDAAPGEYFEADIAPDPTSDPIGALQRSPRRMSAPLAFSFEF